MNKNLIQERHMHAAVLVELHKELEICQLELPESLDYGQVLVKIMYTTICGSQIGEIDGVKGKDHYLPHLLGHEGSGIIMQVGAGVKRVAIADHVVLHWKKGGGVDAACPKYRHDKKGEINAGALTTFNEYAVVSENRLTVISKDFDLRLAPLLGCAVSTGLGVVSHDAQLKMGESILVLGTGGVGLSVVQGAHLTSAYPIIAVDIHEHKLNLAKKLGASHCIKTPNENLEERVREILGESGLDVVVENTGNIELIEKAYSLSKAQGRVVLVGVPRSDHRVSLHSLPLHFGKILTGSHGGNTRPNEDIPRYVQLAERGKLDMKKMISKEYSLNEINLAIKDVREGKLAARALINVSDSQ